MTRLSAQIGCWAARLQTVVGYTYLAGYIALMAIFSVRPWIDIQAFAAEVDSPYFIALTCLQVLAFLQALLALVITIALYEYIPPSRKIVCPVI